MAGLGLGGPVSGENIVETIDIPEQAVGLGIFLILLVLYFFLFFWSDLYFV